MNRLANKKRTGWMWVLERKLKGVGDRVTGDPFDMGLRDGVHSGDPGLQLEYGNGQAI